MRVVMKKGDLVESVITGRRYRVVQFVGLGTFVGRDVDEPTEQYFVPRANVLPIPQGYDRLTARCAA